MWIYTANGRLLVLKIVVSCRKINSISYFELLQNFVCTFLVNALVNGCSWFQIQFVRTLKSQIARKMSTRLFKKWSVNSQYSCNRLSIRIDRVFVIIILATYIDQNECKRTEFSIGWLENTLQLDYIYWSTWD